MPLPHSSSKSHRGEGHVSTGGGSAQICVDKTKDTPRKIGNAKLVGMIRIIIVLQCCPRFFHVV